MGAVRAKRRLDVKAVNQVATKPLAWAMIRMDDVVYEMMAADIAGEETRAVWMQGKRRHSAHPLAEGRLPHGCQVMDGPSLVRLAQRVGQCFHLIGQGLVGQHRIVRVPQIPKFDAPVLATRCKHRAVATIEEAQRRDARPCVSKLGRLWRLTGSACDDRMRPFQLQHRAMQRVILGSPTIGGGGGRATSLHDPHIMDVNIAIPPGAGEDVMVVCLHGKRLDARTSGVEPGNASGIPRVPQAQPCVPGRAVHPSILVRPRQIKDCVPVGPPLTYRTIRSRRVAQRARYRVRGPDDGHKAVFVSKRDHVPVSHPSGRKPHHEHGGGIHA
mmetsp:Transcript_13160/g.38074  ORF Transcript_13160/g.38074 Transcript_13160/m.38074 type:complete len:328 (+) Transcript_13160:1901-2884(+)